jgi:hypothetical protein
MKYYVCKKDQLGNRMVISEKQGVPVDMSGVDVVDLPAGDYLTVISKEKEFPADKVAKAIAAGQIKIEDVRA